MLTKILFTFAAVEMLIVLVFLLASDPTVKNTIALATTIKPETFTELYFENYLKLPSVVTPDQQCSFSFTIHNLENRDMQYHYVVYLQTGKWRQVIADKTVFVRNNHSLTIPEIFQAPNAKTKSEVVVDLINKNQQIGFWITSI